MRIVPRFAEFAGFAGIVEITRLNTSEFYIIWMNCVVMNFYSHSVLSLQIARRN